MNSVIKNQWRLALDFYRRWWWAYGLGLLVFGGVGMRFAFSGNSAWPPMGGGAFLGAVLWATDLNFRTNSRTLLSLPMSVRALGDSIWFLCVPLSGLFAVAAAMLGTVLGAGFGAEFPLGLERLGHMLVMTWCVNAFMLAVLTFLPHRPPDDAMGQVVSALAGGAWGLGIALSFSAPMFWGRGEEGLWGPVFQIILGAGLACAYLSWARAPIMLRERARGLGRSGEGNRSRVSTPSKGLNGLPWLLTRTLGRAALFSLAIHVSIVLTLRLMGMPSDRAGGHVPLLMPLLFVSIALLQPSMASLRHWRTLPLSGGQLALLYTGLPVVVCAGAILPGAAGAVLGISSMVLSLNAGVFLAVMGVFACIWSFIFRMGGKWGLPMVLLLGAFLMPLGVISGFVMDRREWLRVLVNGPVPFLLGLGLLAVAYYWNLRTLRKRSEVYQPAFHLMGRMQWGG